VLEPHPDRLRQTLEAFSCEDVGGTPRGGVSRPAASDTDRAVRDRFATMARDLGLTVRVDDVGNMYARRSGSRVGAEPVLIGSHLDTVVPGGRFDGILGVSVALETVALLNDTAIETLRPLEVVNWTGEEGARFPPAMLGSGVVCGAWDVDYAHSRKDAAGTTLSDELSRIGYLGDRSHRAGTFFASLEAHIEQGTQLEEADADIGVVSSIQPVRWCAVQVTGRSGHAGGPGPAGRVDAMVAAARMVSAARDASLEATDFTTTVGTMTVEPGANNVIPHTVTFNLDIRSRDDDTLGRRLARVTTLFEQIARQEGVAVGVEPTWVMSGPPFESHVRQLLGRMADKRGVRWSQVRGHIGHDSLHLSSMGPAGMIFTRTRNGLSHCEEEFAPWESVLATAGVYANAALALANAEHLTDLGIDVEVDLDS
jgi:beta-ureidopropionase / N-carbamoyl-L-amino-acid hydrolase